jgi:hypothetical protein
MLHLAVILAVCPEIPTFTLAPASPRSYDSPNLNENQHEQNHYAILAYQKSLETVNLQFAAFICFSEA